MLGGVQVQHELAQCPLQPRKLPAQDGEAGASQLGRRLEQHLAQRLAEFEMLLRLKPQVARRAVLGHHDIGGLVAPVRHVGIQNIWQAFQYAADLGIQASGVLFKAGHLVAQRGGFGLQHAGVGAAAPAFADQPGERVAPRLLLLQRGLRRAALGVTRQQISRHRANATPCHGGIEGGGFGADGADIVHVKPSVVLRRGASAACRRAGVLAGSRGLGNRAARQCADGGRLVGAAGMTAQRFEAIPCVAVPASADELDPEGYLAANPDVARAGVDAREHFAQHGRREGREHWINRAEVERVRRDKLERVAFRRPPPDGTGPANFLSPALIAEFGIPEQPPVSALPYWESLVADFRANPDRLYLDLGAGLRRTYYSNVVNAEIYANVSTDVLCVGEDLPFADAAFDGVFAFAVLEHTLRPWQAAAELCRVLKPGGKIIVDWPFLQPVHGYPHHYYNATPEGHRALFDAAIDIVHLMVGQGQKPINALRWLLENWAAGLPPQDAAAFRAMTVADLLALPPEAQVGKDYSRNLTPDAERSIAAGSTLIGTRKIAG